MSSEKSTPTGHFFPWVTYFLLAANVVVYLVEAALSGSLQPSDQVLAIFASSWATTLPHYVNGVLVNGWGTFFLSFFSHASVEHIVGNMTFLLVFAPKVEAALDAHIDRGRVGHAGFLVFYIMAGALANLWFALGDPYAYGIGASGAIAFVLGAFWFLYPSAKIQFQGKSIGAFYYLGTWFLVQAFLDLTGSGGGVAYGAHVGGFIFGVIVTWGMTQVQFSHTAFGLLEVPSKLSLQEEINAAESVVGGDVPTGVSD